jgi:hypothetical protein
MVVALGAAGGFCVVVVVLDCVVLCASTGRDRASTMSDARTTTNSFWDFIRFSFFRLVRYHDRAAAIT